MTPIVRRLSWRLALAVLLTAPALLAAPTPALAAPPAGAVYEGTTSASGTVRIVVNADGTVAVSVQHPGAGAGCAASSLTAGAVPLAANGSQFTITGAAASDGRASMSGFVALPGNEVIAGAFSDEPSAASCLPRAATWSATRTGPPVAATAWPYAIGVRHEGTAYGVTGASIGTAGFTADAGGFVTVAIIATAGGCEYRTTQTAALGAREQFAGPRLDTAVGTGRIAAVTSPTAIGGGFVIDRVSPACPALAGMWIASAPATPPTPAVGAFAAPPNFGTRFIALAVFNGGSTAQLEGAARAAGAAGVWVQDASGRFVLLVVDGPAFINDPFRAGFAAGLPASTAVTLVR